jgi:two-component system, OmpR family, sensor histidine kinase VicK
LPVELTVSSFHLKEARMLLFGILDVSAKEEIERMKQEFISIVSHDLQTPLTSIKIGLTMLEEEQSGQLTDVSRKVLAMSGREADRLVRLTKDLLDLAKAESGSITILKQTVPAAAITEQAIGAVVASAAKKGISIVEDEVSSSELNADPDRICQIIVNFLSNAIKYSPEDTQIRVSSYTLDDCMRFAVTDQGRGIPPEKIGQVFDRFKQVYDSDSKKGTGLGLAICKLLAEAHGGSVSVESEIDKGSTFTLTVPIGEVHSCSPDVTVMSAES